MEIFELIFAAVEMAGALFDGCLLGAEFLGLGADTVAWFKSGPNRRARREARREGREPPPRDRWTIAFLAITWGLLALLFITLWLIGAAQEGWWPYRFGS